MEELREALERGPRAPKGRGEHLLRGQGVHVCQGRARRSPTVQRGRGEVVGRAFPGDRHPRRTYFAQGPEGELRKEAGAEGDRSKDARRRVQALLRQVRRDLQLRKEQPELLQLDGPGDAEVRGHKAGPLRRRCEERHLQVTSGPEALQPLCSAYAPVRPSAKAFPSSPCSNRRGTSSARCLSTGGEAASPSPRRAS